MDSWNHEPKLSEYARYGARNCSMIIQHQNLGGSDAIEKIVVDNRVPLELCPSSNVIGQTVVGYSEHHFKEWGPLSRDHPIAICTDDMGVFKTSLSKEYSLIARHFSLSRDQVVRMAEKSVDLIFSDDELKTLLRNLIVTRTDIQ